MSKPRDVHVNFDICDFKSGPRVTSIFVTPRANDNYNEPCHIEGGTFDIIYSEMQMDYHLFNYAVQNIKRIEVRYFVDGCMSSKETILNILKCISSDLQIKDFMQSTNK